MDIHKSLEIIRKKDPEADIYESHNFPIIAPDSSTQNSLQILKIIITSAQSGFQPFDSTECHSSEDGAYNVVPLFLDPAFRKGWTLRE